MCFTESIRVVGSVKNPVAAVLHTCLTTVTTGGPQPGPQSQLKCYEMEFPLFIYFLIRPGGEKQGTYCDSGLRLPLLLLHPLPVGNT